MPAVILLLLLLLATPAWAGITTTGPTMVPPVKGGTGIDTSSSTGYPHILSGTWSVSATIPFSDLSGSATCAQLPALTGNVTTSAGSCATTIAAGAVTNAMLAGSIDLTTKVTGVLPGVNGGTGLSTAAIGDLIYASATTPTWSRLAAVAAGSYLRSAGTSTAPVWSTLTLPNTVTTGDLLMASATNVVTVRAAVATGQVLASAGTGTAPAYTADPTVATLTASTSVTSGTVFGGTAAGSVLELKATSHGTPSGSFVRVTGPLTFSGNVDAQDYIANKGAPYIYPSQNTGSAVYPFDANGHLIIQPRTSLARDIVLANGTTTPTTQFIVSGAGGVTVGATKAVTVSGERGGTKITASGSAPGAGTCKTAWVAGTTGTTCKQIAYCGTSTTATTIIDNVGGSC